MSAAHSEMTRSLEFTAESVDNERLANLCGALDQNLRQLEEAFDVRISRRGESFSVEGPPIAARNALAALRHFLAIAERPLSLDDIQLGVVELKADARQPKSAQGDDDSPVLHTRRTDLQGRTPRQREYLRNILGFDVTFGVGPAGTGKTYLAVACAVDALERDAVKRIVLTRPAVEAGERLGFLPGDLAQKVDPYLRPLYDALYEMLGFERVGKLIDRNVIEVAPLAYMRGRTLNESYIILDEAQNTSVEQMKMFLTRIGFGSTAVITGDVTQIDLPRGKASGLKHVVDVLDGVDGISFTFFDSKDVVRHPLVGRILDAYERAEAREQAEDEGE